MARAHHRRLAITLAAAAVAAAAIAGCSATNPIATQGAYEASDGAGIAVGAIRAGNLLVLTSAEGAPGTLLGYLTNSSAGSAGVVITLAGDADALTFEVRLAPGETVLLGPDGDRQLELDSVPAAPGERLELTVTTDAGTDTVSVPVLDGTFPHYADLVPPAGP